MIFQSWRDIIVSIKTWLAINYFILFFYEQAKPLRTVKCLILKIIHTLRHFSIGSDYQLIVIYQFDELENQNNGYINQMMNK